MPQKPSLQIQVLGDFRLVYAGELIRRVDGARLQSLLTYLLLHADAPQRRQHVAFLFWPDSSEGQALANLRHQLFHLRRALPEPDRFLCVETKTVQWRMESPFAADVLTFADALARAQDAQEAGDSAAAQVALAEAVDVYGGDLLPSCYEEWILPERERVRLACFEALDRLVECCIARHAYTDAIGYAQRLLHYDPLHEAAYRHLMRVHVLNGDRARALRAYHTCVSTLERELGVEPSASTQELHTRLLQSDGQAVVVGPARARDADLSLVGRTDEWRTLYSAAQATLGPNAHGGPHVVFIEGEAGIGKTRLAEEVLGWAHQQAIPAAHSRAFEAEGRLAYAPVAEWLRSPAAQPGIAKLEAVWQAEIARLLPELLTQQTELSPPQPIMENWQRLRLFEALSRAIQAAAGPLLLVLDDLQWCDQETLEWLHYLLRFDGRMRLLVVGTVRTEEVGSDSALRAVQTSLESEGLSTRISLRPLDGRASTALAAQIRGRMLEDKDAQRLYQETEGFPLFIVETLRAGTQGGAMAPDGSPTIPNAAPSDVDPGESLPPKVYGIIQRRLAQLSPGAHELAGLAAVVGRTFTFDILRLAGEADDMAVVQGMDELWQRRIIREQGINAYDFSHDKIREVAYAEMSPVRRRLLHQRVAAALEQHHAADLDGVSGQIAAHYAQAGATEQAITYYLRAGQIARSLFANREAIHYLQSGIDLAETLPETARRTQLETDLYVTLAPILSIHKGFTSSEVGDAYARALALAQAEDRRAEIIPLMMGRWFHAGTSGRLEEAEYWSRQMIDCVQANSQYASNPIYPLLAYTSLGLVLTLRGVARDALELLQRNNVSVPSVVQGSNQFLFAQLSSYQAWISQALWHQGHVDRARANIEKLLALTRGHRDHFSHGFTLAHSAMLYQRLRRPHMVLAHTEEALALETGPYYGGWLTMLHGWARVILDKCEAGQHELHQGLDQFTAIGGGLWLPYFWSLFVEAERHMGNVLAGLDALDKAMAAVEHNGETFYSAELHRLRGDLLLMQGNADAEDTAVAAFLRALEIAREQSAKILELRTAISLAHLWRRDGRTAEAHHMVSNIYAWFTEGFDIPDLQDARRVMRELSAELE